jgi:hypothetical protein
MYPYPITGKLYKTESGAKKSAEKALKKQEQEEIRLKEEQKSREEKEAEVNWLRLNLEDIKDLPVLMKQRMKDLYNWDLDVTFDLRFGNISNTHNCPIIGVTNWYCDENIVKHYLGWYSRIWGTLTGKVPKAP